MLVCPRCSFTAPESAEPPRCPQDGLFLVGEDDKRRAPRDPFLGTLLGGRYPILGVVGEGGMGRVYRSVQPLVDRPVAVKVIHPWRGDDDARGREEAIRRFMREARAIAALGHPAIVVLHDFGQEPDGTLFMVQELVRGEPLRASLASLSPQRLAAIAAALLDGLGAAHAAGLVHRDVKPENVMLAPGGTDAQPLVKLLDFGIARRVDGDSGALTTAGAIFGTPSYMAPELVHGASVADGRADLWAVGAVLHEGLTGRPPFTGPNPLAVLVAASQNDVPPIRARSPVPPALLEVVARSLARDPAARFPTAEAMAAALRAVPWREAAPVVPRTIEPGSAPPAPAAPPRRWPWAVAAGAVVLAAGTWVAVRARPDAAAGRDGPRSASPGGRAELASPRPGPPAGQVDLAPARSGPPAGQVDLASPPSEPPAGRVDPASPRSEPPAGQVDPASSRSGPHEGRSAPGAARSEPPEGRSAPGAAPAEPEIGRSGPGAAPAEPEIGRSAPGAAPTETRIGRSAPGAATTREKGGRSGPPASGAPVSAVAPSTAAAPPPATEPEVLPPPPR